MMTSDEAHHIIVVEWLNLPAAGRATEEQAEVYARKAAERYRWPTSDDPYEEAKGWLSDHMGKE
jgi:hypothetical protein